jgi:hypothetical protein
MRKIREVLAAWNVSDGCVVAVMAVRRHPNMMFSLCRDVDIAMYLAETVEAQLVMEHYRQTGVNSGMNLFKPV